MPCIFTIDVEDWFHILDLPGGPELNAWSGLESRVERNFRALLDLADEHGARTTCFFLGWVAERHPELVREAHRRGHEIASHGYAHRLVYEMTPGEFRADAERSRKLLEDIAGRQVNGFRAPGFSVTAQTPWFFEEFAASGYRYDSSVFPARRSHGGQEGARRDSYTAPTSSGAGILEFPITVVDVLRPVCCFGGGYLRLFPWALIRSMARKCLNENRTAIFYIHPREVDPGHPRLPMSRLREFKSYVNLHTTACKIREIFKTFPCTSFQEAFYIFENEPMLHGAAALGALR